MLTQLATVKARLALTSNADDPLLTRVIQAVSARIDRFCNRRFKRQQDARLEFSADSLEIAVESYPIEAISRFGVKRSEAEGWQEIDPVPEYLIHGGCIISLSCCLGSSRHVASAIYTGGYVMPGEEIKPGQFALPEDVEDACIEQVAFWYQNRARVGMISVTENNLTTSISQMPLLPFVQDILRHHTRLTV